MEPINYRRAIVRRWPLIVACAIVGAVIAVLVPVHAPKSQTLWQAEAIAGVSPKGTGSSGNASLGEIKFVAEQQQLYFNLAKELGLKKGKAQQLRKDVSIKSKKGKNGLPGGSVEVLAKQPTKDEAAKLANDFVKQLTALADQQLAIQYQAELKQAEAAVTSLGSQIVQVQAQITQLTKPPKKPHPTTTTTYTLTAKSRSGDTFSFKRPANGSPTFTCTPKGVGACGANGAWN